MLVTYVNEFSELFTYITDCYYSRLMLSMTCKILHIRMGKQVPGLFDDTWKWCINRECSHETCMSKLQIMNMITTYFPDIEIGYKLANLILLNKIGRRKQRIVDDIHTASKYSKYVSITDTELINETISNPNLFWWLLYNEIPEDPVILYYHNWKVRSRVLKAYDIKIIPDNIVRDLIRIYFHETDYYRNLDDNLIIYLPYHMYRGYGSGNVSVYLKTGFEKLLQKNCIEMINNQVYKDISHIPDNIRKLFIREYEKVKDMQTYPIAQAIYDKLI